MSYITEKKSANILDQLSRNNLMAKCKVIKLPSDLSDAILLENIIFPYDIRVLSLGLAPVAAPTGAVDIDIAITPGSYQEFGLTGKVGATETGLATPVQYYWKVDGVEYDITTAGTTTFTAVVALMNAAMGSGYTVSVTGGDLRIASVYKTVAVTAGTTGTDLLATLTGFAAMETAVTLTTYGTISVTLGNAVAIPVQEAEDQLYTKNTKLSIACNAAVGSSSENIMLLIHYTIEERKFR